MSITPTSIARHRDWSQGNIEEKFTAVTSGVVPFLSNLGSLSLWFTVAYAARNYSLANPHVTITKSLINVDTETVYTCEPVELPIVWSSIEGDPGYYMTVASTDMVIQAYNDWIDELTTAVNILYFAAVDQEEYIFLKKCHYCTMDDVVTKDYYALQAQGIKVFNDKFKFEQKGEFSFSPSNSGAAAPYSSTVGSLLVTSDTPISCKYGASHTSYYSLSFDSSMTADMPTGITYSDYLALREYSLNCVPSENVVGLAMSQVKSKFTSADMDLLVTLAEGDKTLVTIFNLLAKAKQIFTSFKTGKWRKYAPRLWKKLKKKFSALRKSKSGIIDIFVYPEYISELWMEARYAIRPIVYDIMGLMKVLSCQDPLTEEMTFRAFQSENSDFHGFLTGDDNTVGSLHVTMATELQARSGILASVDLDSSKRTFAQLGLSNIGTTAWELVSYSFVVGWFIDVGNILYALNPSPIFSEKGTWVTVNSSQFIEGYKVVSVDDGLDKETFRLYTETSTRTIDPSTRYFNLDVNLDVPKLLDMIALIRGLEACKSLRI